MAGKGFLGIFWPAAVWRREYGIEPDAEDLAIINYQGEQVPGVWMESDGESYNVMGALVVENAVVDEPSPVVDEPPPVVDGQNAEPVSGSLRLDIEALSDRLRQIRANARSPLEGAVRAHAAWLAAGAPEALAWPLAWVAAVASEPASDADDEPSPVVDGQNAEPVSGSLR